jgi:hypothetical protein
MMTKSKILTVAIVAMFCATAFAVVATEENDADKVTYHIYLQLNDNTINEKPIEKWLDPYDANSKSKDNYLAALKAGLSAAKLDYVISDSGWLSSIGDYASHGEWGSLEYYGFAIYYADGKNWETTSTYDEGTTFCIVFDKYLTQSEYDKLSDKDKEKYYDSGWGYATKLPTVSTTAWESNNTMLYIIIGIVAVIVVIAVVFFVMKKKNASA